MTAAEIAEAKRQVASLVLPAADIPVRRLVPAPRGHAFDARRTLRASLKAGGDVIDAATAPTRKCGRRSSRSVDISGSMSRYTRIFLHFLHSLTDSRRRVSSSLRHATFRRQRD
ncbi:MAG: VWA domain-containing protein [Hyphomicrobiales bacterium]